MRDGARRPARGASAPAVRVCRLLPGAGLLTSPHGDRRARTTDYQVYCVPSATEPALLTVLIASTSREPASLAHSLSRWSPSAILTWIRSVASTAQPWSSTY
jgi:hypothetical protein